MAFAKRVHRSKAGQSAIATYSIMTEIHSLALLSGGMTLARGMGVANPKAL